jgi:hypothetical protein
MGAARQLRQASADEGAARRGERGRQAWSVLRDHLIFASKCVSGWPHSTATAHRKAMRLDATRKKAKLLTPGTFVLTGLTPLAGSSRLTQEPTWARSSRVSRQPPRHLLRRSRPLMWRQAIGRAAHA